MNSFYKTTKGRIFVVIAAVLLLLLIHTVLSQEPEKKPGSEFTLRPKQTAGIQGQDLQITFDEVISDSRCPKDVECVWAGEAQIKISLTHNDNTTQHLLTMPGLSDKAEYLYEDYVITFYLMPYPSLEKQIANNKYRLILMIDRLPQ